MTTRGRTHRARPLPPRAPAPRLAALAVLALAVLLPLTGLGASATVSVPSIVSFSVYDVSVATPAWPTRVTVSFADATLGPTEAIRVSVAADTSHFAVPGGGTAIPASALSWTTHSASGGVGSPGTLSSGAFQAIFDGAMGGTAGSVDLAWTLAALPAGVAAGDHDLVVRYRFEAF